MATPISDVERSTIRKITWRIVPFIVICYFFAYLDRVNVGLASLEMNHEIGLSASIFGFGSGIFFVGYFLFEVPSNLALERFGARRWIARIMITWGIISACMIFVSGAWSFIIVRFLLGAAEAGFYPGVILYITYFFPREYRARIIAAFTVGVPLSLFFGSPISTALLGLHGFAGLSGWKWMFLMEAIPSVLLGFLCLFVLSDRPEKAKWLSDDEKAWLARRLESEKEDDRSERTPLYKVLMQPRVLAGAFIYLGVAASSVGLAVWQPQIIKSFGLTNMEAGLLNSIPYGVATIAMIVWGRMADRHDSRKPFVIIPLLLIAAALVSTGLVTALIMTIVMLSMAVMATYAFKGPFWAFIAETTPKKDAAVTIAHINAIGGLGSFLGTYAFGIMMDLTGSYSMGLLPIAILTGGGALAAAFMGMASQRKHSVASHASPK